MLIAVSVSLETIRTLQGELSIHGIDTSKDNGFMSSEQGHAPS
jgi:hypothetical protein